MLQAVMKTRFAPVVALVAVIWAVEILNLLLGHHLNRLGILPRRIGGLVGIPLAPLLHSGILHAASNTVPTLILGGLVAARGAWDFFRTTAFVAVVGGLGVWLFGRSAYHVGASGLVFGYFGYLVARGVVDRSLVSIVVAVGTMTFYGGLVWGVLPVQVGLSWESHLAGALAGGLAARLFHGTDAGTDAVPDRRR